jgi:hypothetical protein
MTEEEQVQAIVDGAQNAANDLSLTGQHVAALRVVGLVQLARVMWTRLGTPPPVAAVGKKRK